LITVSQNTDVITHKQKSYKFPGFYLWPSFLQLLQIGWGPPKQNLWDTGPSCPNDCWSTEVNWNYWPRQWPPCIADADIIFLPYGFFFYLFCFPRLISAVADWMSAILAHMVRP